MLVEPATAAIANGQQPGGPVLRDGRRDRCAMQAEPLVRRQGDEGLGREAQQVERPGDREMGLVRGVDPDAVEHLPARWPALPEESPEMDVTREGHAHEVGHDAARREQSESVRAVADEVAQPAHDLLLDEGREGTRMPDVDTLVGHLCEQLAHHRDRQRRRREVAELARVLGIHLAARQPVAELGQDVGDRRRRSRRGRRPSRRTEERGPQGRVRSGIAHRPLGGLVVQEVKRGRPGVGAHALHRRARGGLVAVEDELGFGVPVVVVGHGPRW